MKRIMNLVVAAVIAIFTASSSFAVGGLVYKAQSGQDGQHNMSGMTGKKPTGKKRTTKKKATKKKSVKRKSGMGNMKMS